MLVLYVLIGDGAILVAKVEKARNDNSYPNADGEEHAVCGKTNEDGNNDYSRNSQPGRTLYPDRGSWEDHSAREIVVPPRAIV